MSDKFKYLIVTNASDTKGKIDRPHGTTAHFANPVGKGDRVYWDHKNGSSGGVVLGVEHHPSISILIVNVL